MIRKYKKLILPKNYKVKLMLFNNEPTFSMGVVKLLVKIQELGSLNKACKDMNMAYSKGLRIIRRAEDDLGFKLVEGKIGGANGGGSSITDEGKIFLKFYIDINKKLNEFATKYIEKYK